MAFSRRKGLRGWTWLGLGLLLAACTTPVQGPALETGRGSLDLLQATPEAAGLWFESYGRGLERPRWSHTSDVIGRWLYVVGGADADGQMASVERAPIFENGDLGEFRHVSVRMRVPRDCHASVVVGNWLYVLGGDSQGSLDSIERAPIRSGELGPFELVSQRLAVARDEHVAHRVGRYVYVFGGIQGPLQLDSIERAEIRPDGSLGPFSLYRRRLTANRYGHWVVEHGGYLYVVGGLSDNGDASVVERAAILPGGELGPFERVGSRLLQRRDSPMAVVLNGWLYVIAGAHEHAMHLKLDSVEAAPFEGGRLGAFQPAGGLGIGRDYHSVNRIGDWVYVIAGEKTNGGAIGSVERARVPVPGVTRSRRPILRSGEGLEAPAVGKGGYGDFGEAGGSEDD